MQRRRSGAIALICLVCSAPGAAAATNSAGAKRHAARVAYSADEIVVRARAGVDASRLRGEVAERGLSLARRIPHTRLFAVRTNGRNPGAAIESLAGTASVAAASPDYVRRAFDTPNDPYFVLGEPYIDTIRAREAWDLSHGSRGITIAVVDTGVSPVADLSRQLLPGRNMVADSADARDDSTISHGTQVAGIAAATTNNGLGIAGVAWDASVLPVKVLNAQGVGNDLPVAAGIVWAVDHGANIVNLSLGGPSPGATLCDAVSYAVAKGALVVAAVGNTRTATPMYPAACPGVVAVAATDKDGDFASFSNYGPWVKLAAPGIGITSTRNGDLYAAESGTSLAAPIVSGVAALLEAQHPDWTPSQIASQLEDTAQDRGPVGNDQYYGYGLVDAYAALGGPAQDAVRPIPDAFEPNDDATHATVLMRSTTATIAPEGDVDWYAVRVHAPGAVAFRVVGPPYDSYVGPNFQAALQVYDASLNLLAARTGGMPGQPQIVSARVSTAGTYYLRVANDGGARSPGSYSITLTTMRAPYSGRLLFPS